MTDFKVSNGAVFGPIRNWLRAEGLVVLGLSVLLYWTSGFSWGLFFALLLTPDFALLAYLIDPKAGSVTYNIVHSYFLPLSLAVAAIALGATAMLPFLYIWTAHIGLDRSLGYGLKYPGGASHTHLGDLAKGSGSLVAVAGR